MADSVSDPTRATIAERNDRDYYAGMAAGLKAASKFTAEQLTAGSPFEAETRVTSFLARRLAGALGGAATCDCCGPAHYGTVVYRNGDVLAWLCLGCVEHYPTEGRCGYVERDGVEHLATDTRERTS